MPRRVLEIDALRFIAAVMVVGFHWAFRGGATHDYIASVYPPLLPAAEYGSLGVQLFFMISGFVILMSAQGRTTRQFAISRIVRLYPGFWASCTLTSLAILLFADPHFKISVSKYLLNMTLLTDLMPVHVASVDNVYWSLFVEIRFYLFVAAIIALGWLPRAELLLWVWLVVAALLQPHADSRVGQWLLAGYAALFIGGACCYLIYSKGLSTRRLLLLGASFLLALYGVISQTADTAQRYAPYHFSGWVAGGLVFVFYAVMFTIATRGIGLLRHPWAMSCGALTYPLYLLHQNIGYMLINRFSGTLPRELLFWGAFALVLLLAWGVYRFVERPAAPRLKALLERRLRVAQVPRVAGEA